MPFYDLKKIQMVTNSKPKIPKNKIIIPKRICAIICVLLFVTNLALDRILHKISDNSFASLD